ncbi:hypothetical protein GGU10DRAFT_378504 [Lentinula aff. detonsa]|uniref:F-box domain-containing protein n=1 Tax=Lentinula aff. detonsa TaxID=2804958 RepID=A0AA38NK44_9AGAR|nr:hypothetical protein GGU10DRAFT_378504 [Lentinula aff. detonsa]
MKAIRTGRPRNQSSSTPHPRGCLPTTITLEKRPTLFATTFRKSTEDSDCVAVSSNRERFLLLKKKKKKKKKKQKLMSKDYSTSVPGISLQRRFPNEISDLIVGYLVDDLPSLRNVALLCHDFANLARSHIFGQVDLKDVSNGTGYFQSKSRSSGHRRDDYLPLMYRFAALLNHPQTAFLGRFVRRLNFDPCLGPLRNVEQAELDLIISSIFQQLPLLIELSVNRGRLVHLAAAQMYLSQQ